MDFGGCQTRVVAVGVVVRKALTSKGHGFMLWAMVVTLSENDLGRVSAAASVRDRKGREAGADAHKDGHVSDTLALHWLGCEGECAVARGLGMAWTGETEGYHEDSDVGGYQVRTTRHPRGCLLMRPREGYLGSPWILVVEESRGVLRVAGWVYGREGREASNLRSQNGRPPAWFVPQAQLRGMETLPRRDR